MDVSAISTRLKTAAAAANPAAGTDSADPASAFSAMVNLFGSKFNSGLNTGFALGNLEMKLMRTQEPAPQPAQDAQDNSDKSADRAADKKAAKSDDSKTKDAKNDNKDSDNNAADQNASTDAAAQQNQAAVQAAVAVAAQVPVAVQTQAAPTVKVDETTAAAVAATPVEQVQEPAAVTPQAVAQAAAAVAATTAAPVVKAAAGPVAKAADAPVVDQSAAPIVVTAKAVEAAPTVAPVVKTATPVQQAADTANDDANLHAMAADAGQKAATPKEQAQGPANVRSTVAVQQAQNLSNALGSDTKLQVQVQVSGPAASAATQQTAADPSVYDHYVGYTGASDNSTANGQVGVADATNALVQNSSQVQKTPAELVQALAAFPPAPVAPQPPSPPTQQGLSNAASVDAPAQIGATQSTSGQSAAQNNGYAFDSFSPNTGSTAAANAPKTTQAAAERPQVTPQQVIDQIKVNITRATKAGADKVTIQLKPVELGRIDIKLEMSEDQKVRVTVTADNKDTLAMLQGDHKTLERALNDAGLRTDTNNLQFNLRSEADSQAAQQNGGNGRGAQSGNGGSQNADAVNADLDFAGFDYGAAAQARGGVDTFA